MIAFAMDRTIVDITQEIARYSITEVERNVLLKWIIKKDIKRAVTETVVLTEPVLPDQSPVDVSLVTDSVKVEAHVCKELQHFIEIYWQTLQGIIGKTLFINGLDKVVPQAPLVAVTRKAQVSCYIASTHNILLILSEAEEQAFIQAYARLMKIRDPVGRVIFFRQTPELLFDVSSVQCTILHELLHAIQRDDHVSATHGPCQIKIIDGTTVTEKTWTYDLASLEVFRVLSVNGFMSSLIPKYHHVEKRRASKARV